MALQQTLISLQSGPVEVRLARVLEELDRERQAVGEIQRSLLPTSLPELPGFEMSPYYQPSEHASGDYYDVVPLINDQWGFVMADVSGHGTPAAVIMTDRKSTRLNSSHGYISYAVFCLKKKKHTHSDLRA